MALITIMILANEKALAAISWIPANSGSETRAYHDIDLDQANGFVVDPTLATVNVDRSIVWAPRGNTADPGLAGIDYANFDPATGIFTGSAHPNVDFAIAEPGVTTVSSFGGGIAIYNSGYVAASTSGGPGGSADFAGSDSFSNTFVTNSVNFEVGAGPDQPYNFGVNYFVGITTGNGIASVRFSLVPTDAAGVPTGAAAEFDETRQIGQAGTSEVTGALIQSGFLSPGYYSLNIGAFINDRELSPNTGEVARWDTLEFFVAVPEPSRVLLLAVGLSASILRRRRRLAA